MNDNNRWIYWDNQEKQWVTINDQQAIDIYGDYAISRLKEDYKVTIESIENATTDIYIHEDKPGCFWMKGSIYKDEE
jgi:hypothetical protein